MENLHLQVLLYHVLIFLHHMDNEYSYNVFSTLISIFSNKEYANKIDVYTKLFENDKVYLEIFDDALILYNISNQTKV